MTTQYPIFTFVLSLPATIIIIVSVIIIIDIVIISLSTFVHYRGDIMQCGVGKPFNIPSAKLGKLLSPSSSLSVSS